VRKLDGCGALVRWKLSERIMRDEVEV
jgi:hypothetical protein